VTAGAIKMFQNISFLIFLNCDHKLQHLTTFGCQT